MKKFIKRLFDLSISFIGIIVLLPVLILIYVLCKIMLGSPVIFRQERPGLNGKIFTLYKFRSMTDAKDEEGVLLSDKLRLTKWGQFLRKSSLDELPELFNILKGDMSLVGPRPLLVRYLERYNQEQARRHEVRPGLTGLAQINGRNTISWEEKFNLDVWYIDNWSFILDLKIIWLTLLKVIKREGISAEGEATVGEFMGSKED